MSQLISMARHTRYFKLGNKLDLKKTPEKKPDRNDIRMLRAILKKSWKQNFTKQHLYDHLPPISQTIQEWRGRHAGTAREVRTISKAAFYDGLRHMDTPWSADQKKTYIHQLRTDTRCHLDDSSKVIANRDKWWRKKVKCIRATSTPW